MSKADITVQMVVKNEDRFIWYAISSVINYVSQIIIYDTGSTDKTIKIIKSIKSEKIVFCQEHINKPQDIQTVRDQQLKRTKTNWIWIVDGDEVYSQNLIAEIKRILTKNGKTLSGIVVGRYDLLGDIYHHQDNSAGVYDLFGKKGHFALRLINRKNIEGLHVEGVYPYEGYYDKNGLEIIHHPSEKFVFTQGKLFHAMYLKRSSFGASLDTVFHRNKFKIETGIKINSSDIPEVLFQKHPTDVPDVTVPRSFTYETAAFIISPIKNVKRIIIR